MSLVSDSRMFLILCKMDLPGFFLVYFRLFYRQTLQFLQQTDEKMSIYIGIFLSSSLYVYSKISICILPSLCVYYHLYGYSTISMRILPSLCVYYHLYVYTTISMCILPSICVYYHLYEAYLHISKNNRWEWVLKSTFIQFSSDKYFCNSLPFHL